ncbi:hypothetical protein PRVXH_000783 [Proteinivorax hydrogeniformans]|uniref:Secreted protein (Por secretion system target) n=1 Tax=Proteinivorax hydrogeniformans TaxID=1826727 RepID=A0AAU8HVT5_9FIRM
MKSLSYMFIIIILVATLSGCSTYSVTFFESDIVDGNGQHRIYSFKELDGRMVEELSVEASEGVSLSIEVTKGELNLELIDPNGNNILVNDLIKTFDKENHLSFISEDSFPKGAYTLVIKGQKADGLIEIKF